MISAVIPFDQSDSRKATVFATGSGSLMSQPSGARLPHEAARMSKPGMPLAAIVRSGPADTQFTRTPLGPMYRARYLVMASSAALLTPIQSYMGHATEASKSRLTMEALPADSNRGSSPAAMA